MYSQSKIVADPDKEPLLLKADGKIAAARNDNATAAPKPSTFSTLVEPATYRCESVRPSPPHPRNKTYL